MKHPVVYLFFILCLLPIACSKKPAEPVKPLVAVSIPPQKYLVEKIAGDLVEVLVMIPPGASPHSYEPKPAQMAAFSRARVYFTIGVEFEKAWLDRLTKTSPGIRIVPTDSGIAKLTLDGLPDCAGDHDHAHDHEGPDPHVWLSPKLAGNQVRIIANTLTTVLPSHAPEFIRNDSLFALEITALQDSIRTILKPLAPGAPFMVFHPSWGYFAAEFGLRQVAIEVKGSEPSPSELRKIIDYTRREGITTIYAQPQFSRRGVEIISREIGAKVLVVDPLAEAWGPNLIACARALAGAD